MSNTAPSEINVRQDQTAQLLSEAQGLLLMASSFWTDGNIKTLEGKLTMEFQQSGDRIESSYSIHLPCSVKQPLTGESRWSLAVEMVNMINEQFIRMPKM